VSVSDAARASSRSPAAPVTAGQADADRAVLAIARPHPNLLWLYGLQSLAGLFVAPLIFVPFYFKYHTLRYRFDEEGIGASWGILFRREIRLTYRRIQDIHVKRNLIERWLGIATVEVQTASGSSSAELAFEGMDRFEEVRDFLYRRMRGHEIAGEPAAREGAAPVVAGAGDDVLGLLASIESELRAARVALERREG
jgi:membrane protein YdbS with pleckstrin-like domain